VSAAGCKMKFHTVEIHWNILRPHQNICHCIWRMSALNCQDERETTWEIVDGFLISLPRYWLPLKLPRGSGNVRRNFHYGVNGAVAYRGQSHQKREKFYVNYVKTVWYFSRPFKKINLSPICNILRRKYFLWNITTAEQTVVDYKGKYLSP